MHDLIIIGAGPAGITAAIYAARKRLNFLIITKDIGGQAALSADVENYTGYQYITGLELAKKFEDHMKEFVIEVKEGEEVVGVEKAGDAVKVKTDRGIYESKTLIIASGARPRMLNVPGEKEFKNRGVTYCANKIYLININPRLGGDEVMRDKVEHSDKVTVLNNDKTLEILGDKMVTGLRVEKDKEQKILNVRGVFIEIGYMPNSDFAARALKLNERGEIVVDDRNRTSVLGIFAAGDVTNVPQKQIIIAAGEGAKAALSAYEYLAKSKQ